MTNNNVVCTSCGQPKHQLQQRKSKLLPDLLLLMCGECIDAKREPRFVLVLVGRSDGINAISDYIKKDLYVGKPITAQELV